MKGTDYSAFLHQIIDASFVSIKSYNLWQENKLQNPFISIKDFKSV